jgi:hypothetical protein
MIDYNIKNKRYCCDVDGCDNYAYAEMFRTGKHAWMYVCKKHYLLKLKRFKGKLKPKNSFRGLIPKEKGIGFCVLDSKEKIVHKDSS